MLMKSQGVIYEYSQAALYVEAMQVNFRDAQ